jgi:hypothetical protein
MRELGLVMPRIRFNDPQAGADSADGGFWCESCAVGEWRGGVPPDARRRAHGEERVKGSQEGVRSIGSGLWPRRGRESETSGVGTPPARPPARPTGCHDSAVAGGSPPDHVRVRRARWISILSGGNLGRPLFKGFSLRIAEKMPADGQCGDWVNAFVSRASPRAQCSMNES